MNNNNIISSFEHVLQTHFQEFINDQEAIQLQTTTKRLYRIFNPTYIVKQFYPCQSILSIRPAYRIFKYKVICDSYDDMKNIASERYMNEIIIKSEKHISEVLKKGDEIYSFLIENRTMPYIYNLTVNAPITLPITKDQFPHLYHLTLNNHCNVSMDELPTTLKTLSIHRYNSPDFDDDDIEDNESFNKTVDHLPNQLTELIITSVDFHQLVDQLPSSLLKLTLGFSFDRPVDHLPGSLIYLNLEAALEFNQKIDNLPRCLESLFLGGCFNQPINQLPPSLTTLIIGGEKPNEIIQEYLIFNQSLDHLPSSLKELFIRSESFNQSINRLPDTLDSLTMDVPLFDHVLDHLPGSLTYLWLISEFFDQPINHLPCHLEYLNINSIMFNQSLDQLPRSIFSLHITGASFDQSIDRLPLDLGALSIRSKFSNPISILPPTLISLCLFGKFNQSIDQILPQSIKTLHFMSRNFVQPIQSLPSNLILLQFSKRAQFNHPLPPCSLQDLKLPINYTCPLPDQMYLSLQELCVSRQYPIDNTKINRNKTKVIYLD